MNTVIQGSHSLWFLDAWRDFFNQGDQRGLGMSTESVCAEAISLWIKSLGYMFKERFQLKVFTAILDGLFVFFILEVDFNSIQLCNILKMSNCTIRIAFFWCLAHSTCMYRHTWICQVSQIPSTTNLETMKCPKFPLPGHFSQLFQGSQASWETLSFPCVLDLSL